MRASVAWIWNTSLQPKFFVPIVVLETERFLVRYRKLCCVSRKIAVTYAAI